MKWSEGLSNRMFNIIRRHTVHMKFAAHMGFQLYHILSCSFVPFFIIVYMVVCFVRFCLIL